MIAIEPFADVIQMLAADKARIECHVETDEEGYADEINLVVVSPSGVDCHLLSVPAAQYDHSFTDLDEEDAKLRDREQIALGRLMAAAPGLLHELLELRQLACSVYSSMKYYDSRWPLPSALQSAIHQLNSVASGENPLPKCGNVASDIRAERLRQDAKWGEQNLDPFTWLAVLGEEIGEANQAALHDQFGGSHAGTLREELIHAGAVTAAFIECIDRHEGNLQ